MTPGYWLLLLAVTYGAVLFVVFAGLRVAGAADQAADRALRAMLYQGGPLRKSARRARSPAQAVPRRVLRTADSLVNSCP